MKVFGITGWSGSGKTTLITRLVPELIGRGLTVSTVKQAGPRFDPDQPGKDSYEHRQAGATEVLVASASRWALMHELRGAREPPLEDLIARMAPVDVLLVEGFKDDPHPKIEVFRRSLEKPLRAAGSNVIAVASDGPVPETALPVLDLNDVCSIADLVIGGQWTDKPHRPVAIGADIEG